MRIGKFYFMWMPPDVSEREPPELLAWCSLIGLQMLGVALFLCDLLLITAVYE